MLRFVFRLFGLLILAIAFILLVRDGMRSIAANALMLSPLRDDWNNVHSTSLPQLQPLIEKQVGPWAWELIATFLLSAPSWAVLAIVACLLILIGRPKKPLIGYARN